MIEMQLVGDEAAHGRFAGAHKADERDVDDAAVALHNNELTDFPAPRTPQIAGVRRCKITGSHSHAVKKSFTTDGHR